MKGLPVIAALLLGACASAEGNWSDLSGTDIGKPTWTRISFENSRLYLPRAFGPVGRVTSGSLPERTFEMIRLADGSVDLEMAGEGGFRDNISNARFRAIFDGVEVIDRIVDGSTLDPKRKYPITYADFTLGDRPCIAFRRPIGDAVYNIMGGVSAHEGTVTGVYCGASGRENFTEEALGYVRQIRLRQPGERGPASADRTPPDDSPLKSPEEVWAYLDSNRQELEKSLSAYNEARKALVGSNGELAVNEIIAMTLRRLDGDKAFVETSFTVGRPGSSWIAGAGTLLFELQWRDGELVFVGHREL